jgi:hypothetical protein
MSIVFLLQSVNGKKFDQFSAIYHLLVDKFNKHKGSKLLSSNINPNNLPIATRTERRSSITTGVGQFPFHMSLKYAAFVIDLTFILCFLLLLGLLWLYIISNPLFIMLNFIFSKS